jgi:hypothetical protein
MAHIYGKRFDGKVFEIQNWARSKSGDALVMQPLSNTEVRTLHQLRAKGCSDSQIWRQLHPAKSRPQQSRQTISKPGQFNVVIKTLAKDQLIWLIENMMNTSVESLGSMKHEDLIKLATHLGGGKQLRISFAA